MVIDWNFWKHMETVKLWQAALLACNIDPDKIDIFPKYSHGAS